MISVVCEADKKWQFPGPSFFFLRIPACSADAAAVSPKEAKTFLANGLITFFKC